MPFWEPHFKTDIDSLRLNPLQPGSQVLGEKIKSKGCGIYSLAKKPKGDKKASFL